MAPRVQFDSVDRQRGISLVEVVAATAVMAIALFWTTTRSIRNVRALSELSRDVEVDTRGEDVVHAIEKLVRGASAYRPSAWIVDDVGSSDTAGFTVDTMRGFPLDGRLLVDPMTAAREFVDYGGVQFDATGRSFVRLGRGLRGTTARSHSTGTPVRWAAFGEILEGSPARFDGVTSGASGVVRYLGEATGFSYQRWVDVGGSRERGAVVDGVAFVDGYMSVDFEAVSTLNERERGRDLNRDGDLEDVFDIGRLRSREWSMAATVSAVPVGRSRPISPAVFVQEAGAWGGADVDGDGDADPMFLWDEERKTLRIRLVMWVATSGAAGAIAAAGSGRFDVIDTVVRL